MFPTMKKVDLSTTSTSTRQRERGGPASGEVEPLSRRCSPAPGVGAGRDLIRQEPGVSRMRLRAK
jgi:hypothetical protein